MSAYDVSASPIEWADVTREALDEAREEESDALAYYQATKIKATAALKDYARAVAATGDFALIADAYWNDEAPALPISEALGIQPGAVCKLLRPWAPTTEVTCQCGQSWLWKPNSISDRKQRLANLKSDARRIAKLGGSSMYTTCLDCLAVRSAHFAEERRQREERLYELRTMPYQQYLRTPEWQTTRRAALRRARWRCQTCNAEKPLHVHHRTYVRRGNELAADVIALCASCHQTFHETQELVR